MGQYGTIRDPEGCAHPLAARTDVGRSASRFLRLGSAHASQRHAELRWQGERWVAVDTQSRNGTRVNGKRLEPGVAHPLRSGDKLVFGDAGSGEWTLLEVGPPALIAQRIRDGEVIVGEGDVLLFPSRSSDPREAEAIVFRDPDGVWWSEHAGRAEPVEDEQIVSLEDAWRIHLPPLDESTLPLPTGIRLAAITLHLQPDRTGEHVEAWVEHADGRTRAGSGTHWAVALVLARDRLGDAGPAEDRGWMDGRLISRETGIRERSLDTYYSRIRQELRAAGVEDAHRAVEARPHQRRLGVGAIVLHAPA
jgi:hypothetical protein